MELRSRRKRAGDVSLSDDIEPDGDGNSLSLLDTLAEEDDLLENVSAAEQTQALLAQVERALTAREAELIRARYGLGGRRALTQRETAAMLGISRSYVSRIEKKALEKLRRALED